ncbi:hypothetical protein [Agrobacterium tumefaciens]|uniref:Uncharacterized protein n=1 Tax=Agrobacterium tumefaciens TaxID=358 RepID=A0AA44F7W2_AGRTU|nr:hypothetical protein [Agrobacterium tumefaciens]NTB86378.1 hypothetical protein [Agrobacterium tumefaciens]NTC17394.1 hypothetical protein [Agrobacterium tumefaciens]NTC30255.1 hypothetical protein [Agrobacterium tumefaciens]
MAYLDCYVKARNSRLRAKHQSAQIIRGERRAHVVSQVMDILSDFRDNPWQREGAARSGLRSALCLVGHDWAEADHESAGLITAAFQKLGQGARPSWAEGQAHYAMGREACARCGNAIGEDQKPHRYCSVRCAKLALQDQAFEKPVQDDVYGRDAWKIIAKTRTVPRTCALPSCGKAFRVWAESRENRYCSKQCRSDSMRTRVMRRCANVACGKEFLPSLKDVRCCSMACASAIGKRKQFQHTCQAPGCSAEFLSAMPYAKYCSGKCNARAHYHRKKQPLSNFSCDDLGLIDRGPADVVLLLVPLTAAAFDGWFRRAA